MASARVSGLARVYHTLTSDGSCTMELSFQQYVWGFILY